MKYVDEFRDRKLIDAVAREIRDSVDRRRTYNFMEVCGTHTVSIFRYGLKEILPENINLISGPGCPVCVTSNIFLDRAMAIAGLKDTIVATFGDLIRVPGSYSSLEKERARGSAIKIVYSTMDALEVARRNKNKEVVFLGVGFETTAPTVAQSILIAGKERLKNYSVLSGHKTMPAALAAITEDKLLKIDGFLLPGHVSVIIGARPYEFLASRHGKRCAISGFEPLDIMQSILMLVKQARPKVEIQYARVVESSGNRIARHAIDRVFVESSSVWRGMGTIKKSGLAIRKEFSDFASDVKFDVKVRPPRENGSCICGDVIRGARKPTECRLFGKACRPDSPVGACMVSSEGTCAAYYKYCV